MDWPFISIIIPTYGRDEALRDSIKDAIAQDYPTFEILVVDQKPNHPPEIQLFLEQRAEAGEIQLFILDWASLPGARNYAVRRAKGEILLFLDDDVVLEPGFLKTHAQVYLDQPEVGAVAGRVLDRMKLADAQREDAAGAELGSEAGCCDRPPNPQRIIEDLPPEAMDPGIAWYHMDLVHTIKPQRVLTARGCNMSFRQEIFDQHGIFFDERFGGSAIREESDFCLRIRKTGYQIWYAPEAQLVHLGEESGGCHDVSQRSLQYQLTFYHNHFLMGLKNLSLGQNLRFFAKLFDCHVLGHPPCNKSPSLTKTLVRGSFYALGLLKASATQLKSLWDHGQIHSRQDPLFGK
ncbi:MAG: glycosyltransferase family 2 protein [Synechococcales cyanobacterium RM1_1_8]|nr:glycosyltransferase family 2 protein [Synechococcales cyanobacterium RM1_1_8]